MKGFSGFCIALSAAALLAGGLPGPAQSEEPEGGWSPTITRVNPQGGNYYVAGYYSQRSTWEDPNWTGFSSKPSSPRDRRIIRILGLSPRELRSHPSFKDWTGGAIDGDLHVGGEGGRKLLLDVVINPKTFDPKQGLSLDEEYHSGPYITFSDMEVGADGSFSKTLEDGRSIVGKIPYLGDPLASRITIRATYSGLNGLKVYYNKDNGLNRSYSSPSPFFPASRLRSLMFYDSHHYSKVDYEENLERLKNFRVPHWFYFSVENKDIKREHIERGKSISERDDLSVSLRANVDRITEEEERGWNRNRAWRDDFKRWQAYLKDRKEQGLPIDHDFGPLEERSRNVKNVSCDGLSCTGMLGKLKLDVLSKPRILPLPGDEEEEKDILEDVHALLANQGIYLTVYAPDVRVPTFGAWMNDAGFFVVTGGIVNRVGKKYRLPSYGLFPSYSTIRRVAVVGDPTKNGKGERIPPAGDATWRGSMVGTAMRGLSKDNFLRGEAELKFAIADSRLDARFFNIRDYSRFGEKYMSVNGKKPNQIVFPDIPVAADGSYERKYRRRVANHKGSISGAFYGTGHRETAGTFQVHGILGAFGAKKVEKAAVPEAAAN